LQLRLGCEHCLSHSVEWIAWAERRQRQTRRLQQHLAVQTMSMPISHVAALHRLDWATVRRCQDAVIERWEKTRPTSPLRQVGVDEKYLGRRNNRPEKFITIVSNLATGEPVWIGEGRREDTLASWLDTLDKTQKSNLQLFAMDKALNNNWETLVRRGRGYRDLPSLMRLLRFMIVHPIRRSADIERFLALGVVPNPSRAHAA
jgi:transposase